MSGMNTNGGVNTGGIQNTPGLFNPNALPQPSTPLDVLIPAYITQLSQTKSELAELDQQQTVKMLKELLNMPKNFDKLMEQLTTPNSTLMPEQQKAVKTALMMLASSMNLSQLSSLLQNSSKTAMTNLYQMLAQYNQLGISIKDEQLGQISKLISFISASSTSDVQSLKSTMLMYLPWLPLTDPNVLKLEIGNSGSDGGESDSDSITVMIATENYGNLSAYILKTDEDGIKIQITSSQTFPQKDFIVLMKEESKKYGININFETSTKEAFNKEKNEHSQTQVYMNTSPGVNPFLLLISNALIKNVHLVDSKENLRELRKERVDNGKSQN
ncbi:hypothetical protein IJ182_07770 [bacterium]|nr:hypothetical protein [bacterium]